MTKLATALSASGNVRTMTVRGYTPDEFSKLAAEARRPNSIMRDALMINRDILGPWPARHVD